MSRIDGIDRPHGCDRNRDGEFVGSEGGGEKKDAAGGICPA